MTRTQKGVMLTLCLLSLFFLFIFIFPNLQGAKNSEMLSVFEPDEYAQYPYVLHMLTPGATVFASIHNFAVYLHYYYGYPFYFFSALAILPVKLISGANWTQNTALIVMALREAINVLPMLLAVLLLVWMQTRFKSYWKSLVLFLLLALIPEVVLNNLWWHPDSLLVLFCVLTLFFLQRDDFRFGKNFFFSAIACGFAIGTKVLGVLFVGTYAAYLIYGLAVKRITFWQAIKKSLLFLLIMAASIVLTNPLLLLPIERSEIIAVFKANYLENSQGFWVSGGGLSQNWQTFVSYIRLYYGRWIFVLVSTALTILGLFRSRTRVLSLAVLSWAFTYIGYFLFMAATLRPHYFLPVMLPLTSFLIFPFIEMTWRRVKLQRVFQGLSGLLIAIMLGIFVHNGVMQYGLTMEKESTSMSIHFFEAVDQTYLDALPAEKSFTFYRDWRAYVAPQQNWNVSMSWNLMDYATLQSTQPDFVFLEAENISYFSDQAKLTIALDETVMKNKYAFYSDAKANSLRGYTLLAEGKFGKVFVREDIGQEYFSTVGSPLEVQ